MLRNKVIKAGYLAPVSHSPAGRQRHSSSSQPIALRASYGELWAQRGRVSDWTGGVRESFLEEVAPLPSFERYVGRQAWRERGSKGHWVKKTLRTEREIQRQDETLRDGEILTAVCRGREKAPGKEAENS